MCHGKAAIDQDTFEFGKLNERHHSETCQRPLASFYTQTHPTENSQKIKEI